MQLRLPLVGTATSDAPEVVFVRHRRARRYILRVRPDGTLRVTLPRWGVRRDAQAFVEASGPWIARQRSRLRQPRAVGAWRDGTGILVDGHKLSLRVEQRTTGVAIWCDAALVDECPTVPSDLRPLVEGWLRRRAARELPEMLHALATVHGITVPRVSVRDQRSRWGACSPTGTITLNWRLIQMPPLVREYVVLHELMHRRELNHSKRFWRLVSAACPQLAVARDWLRKEGKTLWSERD